jgi:hypothetical protein
MNLRRSFNNGKAIGWMLIGVVILGILCCGFVVEALGLA